MTKACLGRPRFANGWCECCQRAFPASTRPGGASSSYAVGRRVWAGTASRSRGTPCGEKRLRRGFFGQKFGLFLVSNNSRHSLCVEETTGDFICFIVFEQYVQVCAMKHEEIRVCCIKQPQAPSLLFRATRAILCVVSNNTIRSFFCQVSARKSQLYILLESRNS
jgi:hypothetical protein